VWGGVVGRSGRELTDGSRRRRFGDIIVYYFFVGFGHLGGFVA
jgi:hypothetical protein